MNLTKRGKFSTEAKRVPRHSAGISAHASPSVFPAKGPEPIRQSTPVSQASPIGSCEFDFSGKRGASEHAPQMRGTKMGSMRVGAGLTVYDAASARAKKREARADTHRAHLCSAHLGSVLAG